MPTLHQIDAFPAFLEFWQESQNKTLEVQIDDWANAYMQPWPELLQKQLDDYTAMNDDWRLVAREHVFPYLDQRLPAMIEAHNHLSSICEQLYSQSQQEICLDCDVTVLFYVGIGCGAGWVTTYNNKPTILFGLENIAEEGWSDPETLRGLVAHELGHVTHFHWRDAARLPKGEGSWWQLYIEGFAMYCEQLTMTKESWHMQVREDEGWLDWCQANTSWLAAEFLRSVDAGESVRPFFGSWYNLQGYKQTGYFLGHHLIKILAADKSLQEIALLDDFTTQFRQLLEQLSSNQ